MVIVCAVHNVWVALPHHSRCCGSYPAKILISREETATVPKISEPPRCDGNGGWSRPSQKAGGPSAGTAARGMPADEPGLPIHLRDASTLLILLLLPGSRLKPNAVVATGSEPDGVPRVPHLPGIGPRRKRFTMRNWSAQAQRAEEMRDTSHETTGALTLSPL